jgi:hypothetical protein
MSLEWTLDYVVLRLETACGLEPVGGERAEPGAAPRGWIALPHQAPPLTTGDLLYVLHYPDGRPLQLSIESDGIVATNVNGTRLRYHATTEPGSSGAPCFNANWQIVAMHHASRKGSFLSFKKETCEGITVSAIRARLQARGFGSELDDPPQR